MENITDLIFKLVMVFVALVLLGVVRIGKKE